MRFRFTGLWRHPEFLKLWAGQTVSVFGSQITFLALPLTAIIVLDATPAQIGVLTAIGGLPSLLIGVFVGAWVDRRRRRPILIVANWGRAALLLIIPVTSLLGILRLELLYVVAFCLGASSLFFDVAYRSFLPSLVGRERLIEGNSKLEISNSAAEIGGPGLGGVLVQLITAPIAIIVDSITFMASAISFHLIQTQEPEPTPSEHPNIWKEAGEGLKVVAANPVLRALAGCAATVSLFNTLFETVSLLYMTRHLGLNPGLIGLIFSIGGVGFLVGALTAERTTRWIGLGPAIMVGIVLMVINDLVLPLVSGPTFAIVILLALAAPLFGFGLTTFNVGQVSLRQAITPDRFQGRMNATMRVMLTGVVPIGALIGGALGETIGLRPTLFIGAAGELLAVGWLLFSPVRALREQPEPQV